MFTYLTIDLLTDESIAMIWINGFVPDQYQLLFVALLLDALVGELGWIFKIVPHPIAILGRLIGILEAKLNRAHRSDKTRLLSGGFVVVFISALSLMVGWGLTVFVEAHRLWVLELLIITILVAQRSLYLHVRAVAVALDKEDLAAARRAVAHVVGRDPEKLDKGGVARAAIETLAENFADAVIAPVLWYLVFGLPGLLFCKAVNTMDSMLGHRSKRYVMFGRVAARLDDAVMWIPARLSVMFLITACIVTPTGKPLEAIRIVKSDAGKHPSINAGWPEAALDGALGFALGGPRYYSEGQKETAWIGAGRADLNAEDIKRSLYLFVAACLKNGICIAALSLISL